MSSSSAARSQWLGSNFRVLIGEAELGCSEVLGLGSETAVGADGAPGASVFTALVVRRALDNNRELFDWRAAIMSGTRDLRCIDIELLDEPGGATVQSWRIDGAWPCRWSGPMLNAITPTVALEEVEIVYSRLTWIDNSDSGGS